VIVDKIRVTLSIFESGIHPFSGKVGNIKIMNSHSCGNDTGRLVQGILEIGSKKFNLHGLRCIDCGALVLTFPELGSDNTITYYEGIQSLRNVGVLDIILSLLYKSYLTMSGGERDNYGEFYSFDGEHYVWDPVGEASKRDFKKTVLNAWTQSLHRAGRPASKRDFKKTAFSKVGDYISSFTNKKAIVELNLSEDSSTVRYEGKVGRETIHQHNCVGDTARHIQGSMNLGDDSRCDYELKGKRCINCGDMFLNASSLGLTVKTIWFNGISSISDISAETVLMAFIRRDASADTPVWAVPG
jgi:hypothetical protein